MSKFNIRKRVIKASSPSVVSSPKRIFGTFSHRNPFTMNSDNESAEFDAESAECCSEMPPMKRAKISDVNSGSPLLTEGESKLVKLIGPLI